MRLKPTPSIARWTTRCALFALSLTVVALCAHRFGPMPTLTAFNLIVVSITTAVLTLLMGLAAAIVIWRQGTTGAIRVSFGVLIALGLICWPAAFLPAYRNLPRINDVSTDTTAPPRFTEAAKYRGPGSNGITYPVSFARPQSEAYPDIKPMLVERPVEETFEITRDAVLRQKLSILREQPPEVRAGRPGTIEAVDRTLIFGFYDDVALRIDGDNTRSRIDLRSASRFGGHDLGRNAERMRRLMREIVARLEATVPTASGERFLKRRLLTKKALEAVQKSKARSSSPDASRSATQRELEQKGQPRSR